MTGNIRQKKKLQWQSNPYTWSPKCDYHSWTHEQVIFLQSPKWSKPNRVIPKLHDPVFDNGRKPSKSIIKLSAFRKSNSFFGLNLHTTPSTDFADRPPPPPPPNYRVRFVQMELGLFRTSDWVKYLEEESYPVLRDFFVLPLFVLLFPSLRLFLDMFVFEVPLFYWVSGWLLVDSL